MAAEFQASGDLAAAAEYGRVAEDIPFFFPRLDGSEMRSRWGHAKSAHRTF